MRTGSGAGVLVVDKEQGPTSHDVVARVRRLAGLRRVGHCGTLDPLATGVLIVCLGPYTRLARWLGAGEKEYEAVLHLGASSATGDSEGPVTPRSGAVAPTVEQIQAQLPRLTGDIEQVPPAFSAVKVGGVPSHRLARRQRAVPLAPRRVRILRLDLLAYAYPVLRLRMVCSAGTYVRSLAADLGEALGCGAYVQDLRRLRVGSLTVEGAHTLEQLGAAAQAGRLDECMAPPRRALADLPALVLNPDQLRAFAHGQSVVIAGDGPAPTAAAVYDAAGRLWGIGRWHEGQGPLRPDTVVWNAGPDGSLQAEPRFAGVVRAGRARGRTLGFPTANLEVPPQLAADLPGGVFAAWVRWPGEPDRGALVNIGSRPTFGETGRSIEVHVLDFSGDLYGRAMDVEIVRRLRDERRFPSAEALVEQLHADREQARAILAEEGPARANQLMEV